MPTPTMEEMLAQAEAEARAESARAAAAVPRESMDQMLAGVAAQTDAELNSAPALDEERTPNGIADALGLTRLFEHIGAGKEAAVTSAVRGIAGAGDAFGLVDPTTVAGASADAENAARAAEASPVSGAVRTGVGLIPWVLPGGQFVGAADVGGNRRLDVLDRGGSETSADLAGGADAALALLIPKVIGKLLGPVAGRTGEAVADRLGEGTGRVIEKGIEGAGTGAGLATGAAGVSAATGDTERAKAELASIPSQAAFLALLSGGHQALREAAAPSPDAELGQLFDQAAQQHAIDLLRPENAQVEVIPQGLGAGRESLPPMRADQLPPDAAAAAPAPPAAGEPPAAAPAAPATPEEQLGHLWSTLAPEQRDALARAVLEPAAPPAAGVTPEAARASTGEGLPAAEPSPAPSRVPVTDRVPLNDVEGMRARAAAARRGELVQAAPANDETRRMPAVGRAEEPPRPPGTVRLYHGGSEVGQDGPLWFTSDRPYAEGYRRKSGGTGRVAYVDLPADHPLIREQTHDETGHPTGATVSLELPKELAGQRQALPERSFTPPREAPKMNAAPAEPPQQVTPRILHPEPRPQEVNDQQRPVNEPMHPVNGGLQQVNEQPAPRSDAGFVPREADPALRDQQTFLPERPPLERPKAPAAPQPDHDILDAIREAGGVVPKPRGYQGGEYDDAPQAPTTRRAIAGREVPDVIAARIKDAGYGDGSVRRMWELAAQAERGRRQAKTAERPPQREPGADEAHDLTPADRARIRGRHPEPAPFARDRVPGDQGQAEQVPGERQGPGASSAPAKAERAPTSETTPGVPRPTVREEPAAGKPEAQSSERAADTAPGHGVSAEARQAAADRGTLERDGRLPIAPPAGAGAGKAAPGPVKPLRTIIDGLADWLGAQTYPRRKLQRNFAGYYSPSSGGIVLKRAHDLDVVAHELGHWLDDRFGVMEPYQSLEAEARGPEEQAAAAQREQFASIFDHELRNFWPYGSNPPAGMTEGAARNYQRAEGVAEYLRAWMVNPEAARKAAPLFTARFETSIPERVRDRMREFGDDVRQFHHAGAIEAGGANIRALGDTGPTMAERLAEAWTKRGKTDQVGEPLRFGVKDWLRVRFTDELAPLYHAIRWAGEQRGELGSAAATRAEMLIRLLPGRDDKASAIARLGMVKAEWLKDGKIQFADGVHGGLEWLGSWADTSSEASIRRDLRGLDAYLVAQKTIETADQIDAERAAKVGELAASLHEEFKATQAQLEKAEARLRGDAEKAQGRFGGAVDRLGDVQDRARELADLSDEQLARVQDAAREAAAEPGREAPTGGIRDRAEAAGRRLERVSQVLGDLHEAVPRGREGMSALRQRVLRAAERVGRAESATEADAAAAEAELRHVSAAAAKAAAGRVERQATKRAASGRDQVARKASSIEKAINQTTEAIERGTAGIGADAERTVQRLRSALEASMVSKLNRLAKHAQRLERADRARKARLSGQGGGTRPDDEQARRIVAEVANDPVLRARLDEGAKRYRAWANGALRYLVDKGRLSQEAYDQITAKNQQYAAMHRIMEDGTHPGFSGGGKLGTAKNVVQKRTGSQREIDNPLANMVDSSMRAVAEADRNEAVRSFVDLLRDARRMYQGDAPDLAAVGQRVDAAGEGVLTVFRNGEPEYWKLAPELHDAVQGMAAAPRLNGVLTLPGKILRATVVNSPPFAVRNVIRDTLSRLVIGQATPEGVLAKLRHLRQQTPLIGRRIDDLERAMVELAGGAFSGHYMRSKENWHTESEKRIVQLRRDKSTILAGAQRLGGSYLRMIRSSEFAGRAREFVGVFEKLKRQGIDEMSAALMAAKASRDLIDFAQAGRIMREINQLVPFTNAAVQGLRATKHAIERNPGGVLARWTATIVMPTVAIWAANLLAGHDDEYRNLPAWRRDLFWNIRIAADTWLTIPKPFELGIFASGVDRGLDAAVLNHRGMPAEQAIERSYDGFGGSMARGLMPLEANSLMGPYRALIDTWYEEDSFSGKKIVPDYERKLPVDQRDTSYASRLGEAGQFLSGNTVDARNVDHLIRGFLGGLGGLATTASDLGRADKPGTLGRLSSQTTGVLKGGESDHQVDVRRFLDQEAVEGRPMGKAAKTLGEMRKEYWQAASGTEREAIAEAMRDYATGRDPLQAFDTAVGAANQLESALNKLPIEARPAFIAANGKGIQRARALVKANGLINKAKKRGLPPEKIREYASKLLKSIDDAYPEVASTKARR